MTSIPRQDSPRRSCTPGDPERAVVAGFDSTWQPVSGLGLVLSALTLGIVVAVGVGGAVRRARGARPELG